MLKTSLGGSLKLLALTTVFSASMANWAFAEPKVVTSIKPVHSLVSAVMKGIGEPKLILQGAASPHDYALKPSQAEALQKADLVFWVGPDLEQFMKKPIETIAKKSASVELLEAPGLKLFPFRDDHHHGEEEHAGHDEHGHDEHKEHAGHKDHDDHDHDDHKHDEHGHDEHKEHAEHKDHDHDEHDHGDHKHDEHKHEEHGHDEHKEHAEHKDDDDHSHAEHAEGGNHDGHDHAGEFDPHIWLDPDNAEHMVDMIEKKLVTSDPANAEIYKKNADETREKLAALTLEIKGTLSDVREKNYVVFHDAYQYFEHRFSIKPPIGSIRLSPEVNPGAQRVAAIRENVKSFGSACIFSEPQFSPKLIATVAEGLPVKTGILDPLGATLEDGPDLYANLLKNMANSVHDCLSSL